MWMFSHQNVEGTMKKNWMVLIAVLFLFEIGLADNEDTNSFPKGQLVKSVPLTTTSGKGQALLKPNKLYYQPFNEFVDGWALTGEWHIGQLPLDEGGGVALASTRQAKYQPQLDSRSIGPMIDLPTIDPSRQKLMLTLREKFEIESSYDQGYLEVSIDDGASWISIHGRSGKSDWCETLVDISHFSGKTIRPAFRLLTDKSEEFSGWQIESMGIELQEIQQLDASLISLNPQGFPYIYMNVAVNSGASVLSQTNFAVYENGVLQTDYYQVAPPQTGSGNRLSDIVFLMDNSGSMGDDQAAVYNNVRSFVDNLSASGVNYALGLCRFGMSEGDGNPIFENSGQLTQDPEYFKNTLWSYNTVYGSREPGYDAVLQSCSAFSFRPGTQKIFILITDERPDQGNATVNAVLNACTSGSITLFVLTTAELNSYYTTLASATNGAIFDIRANFNTILHHISSQVSNNYVVQYRSSNPIADGVERQVEVRINWNTERTSVYGSYVPGAVPQILRTAATLALEAQAWAAHSSLIIEVEVIDRSAPYVASVTLYCRTTGSRNYYSIGLTRGSGSIWRGQLPETIVDTPGVDYYLTASDGSTTVSTPAVNPIDAPYQIAVLPNVAPLIVHTPITQAARGLPITVTIEAMDVTNRLSGVRLYYKRTGQLTFQSNDFSFVSGNTYVCEIPAEYVTLSGVDYLIKAWDDLGVASTHGTFDLPHNISTSISGSWRPILLDPVANKVGMGVDLWLSWEASTGATAYRIVLDDDANFSSPEFSRDNFSKTRIFVSGLKYATRYYWRVQSKNSQSISEWSQVSSFVTMSQPPVAITAPSQYVLSYLQEGDQCYTDRDYTIYSLPSGLQNNLSIKVANADKKNSNANYISFNLSEPAILYIAYDQRSSLPPDWLNSGFVPTDKKLVILELDGSLTVLELWKKTLQPGAHILGGNLAAGAVGAAINYLVLFGFSFDPFALPEIISPVEKARYVSINPTKFVWRKFPGAKWYHFNLNTAKSAANVIVYDYGITDTTFQVNNLELDRTYYWRLRVAGPDRRTEWTDYFSFTTGIAPTVVDLSISGPSEVKTNSYADYTCTAVFSDGTRKDITDSTAWTENSDFVQISRFGHLTTSIVSADRSITLEARYSGCSASKTIAIKERLAPVIFIPGIMGSPLYDDINSDNRLFDNAFSLFNERIWIDPYRLDNLLQQVYLLALRLDESGENSLSQSNHIKVAPLRGDGGNTLVDNLEKKPLDCYKGFFDYFARVERGYILDQTELVPPPSGINLFCYSYDWRKSIAWSGKNLSAFIDSVLKWTKSNKVNIVAHSMGGLVAKSCVKNSNTERINKLIFIGTPHLGAPKIYYTMLTGDVEFGLADKFISNETIKIITKNMPSTYQLFPSKEYFDTSINNGGLHSDLYAYSLSKVYPFRNPPQIENLGYFEALKFFKELRGFTDNLFNANLLDLFNITQEDISRVDFGNISVYNIVGIGTATIGHISVFFDLFNLRYDHLPIYSVDGDGTVPLKSAETINGQTHQTQHTYYVPDCEHTELASDDRVTQIIERLLKEPAIVQAHPLPNNHTYSNLDVWQSILACPVIAHVYDDLGRHTGPTSDSTFAEEIPGSRYIPANLADPESKKIFLLPIGGVYNFEIISQDTTGHFDFNVLEIINGKVTASLAFDSIKIVPTSRAYCRLTALSPQLVVNLDEDGNGSIDTILYSRGNCPTSANLNSASQIIADYSIYQNYPNPFNHSTIIKFDLPEAEHVKIVIFNSSGQQMLTLVDQRMTAGNHEVLFDGSELASGVYFYRITAGSFNQTRKVALVK